MISNLPQNIIESILSLMPLRDALRTSILSKKWRYSWRSMPKLTFTEEMVELSSSSCRQLKCKVVKAIFHVLLLHNGPEIVHFDCSVGQFDHMETEITHIFSYLAKRNTVKQVIYEKGMRHCKFPVSFFSLQGLERMHIQNCTFEPPLEFNGFSRLTRMTFMNVEVSVQMLQLFLSKCPLLEHIFMGGCQPHVNFAAGGDKLTFVDLLQCVPLIQTLDISNHYIKNLFAVGMPHKLPTSLVNLKYLNLSVCLMKQNEISFALFMIRRSPMLEKINFWVCDDENLNVRQTPTNILDLEDHPDLKLNHLETLEIKIASYLPVVTMDFVKLIMAKSPVLKIVRIVLYPAVSVDEEVKMLRDLVLLPFPRASPSAKLIVARGKWKYDYDTF